MPTRVRLNKFLRDCQLGSRRACEKLVTEGRVTIDGVLVTSMATLVDVSHDVVEVDGRKVKPVREQVYVAANKPRGVVVTASDPQGRETLYQRIGDLPRGVFCVGRLDRDSEGLVLLTNDGKLAFRLAHPKYGIERVYEVVIRGPADPGLAERLTAGVELEDGVAKAKSAEVVGRRGEDLTLNLVLTEGKKREVRRMIAACGLEVGRLRRVRFGSVVLGKLAPGSWRALARDEIRGLRRLVGEAYSQSSESSQRRRAERR